MAEISSFVHTPGVCRVGNSRPVFRYQMVDVFAVGLGERCAFEEEDVLGVELGAPGEIVGAGDNGVVDDEDFVVHEIVPASRAVGRRVFSDEGDARDDFQERGDFPAVRWDFLPLHVNVLHLGAIVDAIDMDPTGMEQVEKLADEGAGVG